MADSLEGEFTGCDVFNDDMGYAYQGIAQGGIVDTPDGDWYAVLFQDRGAVGRTPMLIPVHWENDFPVFGENGKMPVAFETASLRPEHEYVPLLQSDDFKVPANLPEEDKARLYGSFGFKSVWQFNHEPDLALVKHDCEKGYVEITTGKISANVTQAKNTLTQRMLYPGCLGEVTVNVSNLQDGDYAGLCALQGYYGFAGVTKKEGKKYLVMVNRETPYGERMGYVRDTEPGQEWEAVPFEGNTVRLKVETDFTDMKDEAKFYYFDAKAKEYRQIGKTHKLYFKLDHFTGCRFGLFVYSTKVTGGSAGFENFVFKEKWND